jgi:hypothetical protein
MNGRGKLPAPAGPVKRPNGLGSKQVQRAGSGEREEDTTLPKN